MDNQSNQDGDDASTEASNRNCAGTSQTGRDYYAYAFIVPELDDIASYFEHRDVVEWLDNFPDGAAVTITVEVPPRR